MLSLLIYLAEVFMNVTCLGRFLPVLFIAKDTSPRKFLFNSRSVKLTIDNLVTFVP